MGWQGNSKSVKDLDLVDTRSARARRGLSKVDEDRDGER